MTRELETFRSEVVALISKHQGNRDFNTLLSSILADLNELSDSRMNAREILSRMFTTLNKDRANPFDDRTFTPAFQAMMPIAMSTSELSQLLEILRTQVYVHSATGDFLDELGVDHNFPRFEASPRVAAGITTGLVTLDNTPTPLPTDFPIGSRLATRDTGVPLIFEIIETLDGNATYRHIPEEPFVNGDIANAYFGELSQASPINNFVSATITATLRPGQNREIDEEYKRRFLAFLQRKAFAANVAAYKQFVQAIDGVYDLMVFPCWRGAWHVNISIVGANVEPVSQEFCDIVRSEVDPRVRSGTGFGMAAVGHRVNVMTPEYQGFNIDLPLVLRAGVTIGQAYPIIRQIIYRYIDELRQAVLDTWDNTYFQSFSGIDNSPIQNKVVEFEADILSITGFIDDNRSLFAGDTNAAIERMLKTLEHFPAALQIQTHTFEVLLQPQFIGTRILQEASQLVFSVDFANIRIDGGAWINGFPIASTETLQRLPKLETLNIIEV